MNISKQTGHRITYMEVYGSNRVIYRVTADRVSKRGSQKPAYGVILEDMRTGEQESISDFSESLEQTIRFANDLVENEIRPERLFDIALRYLSAEVSHV